MKCRILAGELGRGHMLRLRRADGYVWLPVTWVTAADGWVYVEAKHADGTVTRLRRKTTTPVYVQG